MTDGVGWVVAGFDGPGVPARSTHAWVAESLETLALLATRRTYEAEPGLWRLGEHGRARTLEDFTHHLRAALGNDALWTKHLAYSLELFDARGFPQRWLTEAFATLREVVLDSFPDSVTRAVAERLEQAPAVMAGLALERGIDLNRPTAYDPST